MLEQEHSMHQVFSPQEIAGRVTQLGAQISADYAGQNLVLMVVLGGAFVFAADLCRAIHMHCSLDFIRVASYGGNSRSSGEIRLVQAPSHEVSGKHILLVEDIVDTGLTVEWLLRYFQERKAASVKLCAFIDKPERRRIAVEPDYTGFRKNGFLVGYGLDYAEKYRNLPAVHELEL